MNEKSRGFSHFHMRELRWRGEGEREREKRGEKSSSLDRMNPGRRMTVINFHVTPRDWMELTGEKSFAYFSRCVTFFYTIISIFQGKGKQILFFT